MKTQSFIEFYSEYFYRIPPTQKPHVGAGYTVGTFSRGCAMSRLASASRSDTLRQRLVAAFDHPIPQYGLSAFYKFALTLAAMLVVMLPLVYIAIMALVGYGVYYHAVNHTGLLTVTGTRYVRARVALFFLYLAPIVGGVLVIGFMLKPFLAPRRSRDVGPTLTANDEPLLFDFIARLCRKLGAPFPRRIEVNCDANAAAGFRRGWLSLFSNDLVLVIGMPLAAKLDVAQLAGVIAHEFGHFRQRTTMRLSYIIRSVNGWFARVVYERDSWDASLHECFYSGVWQLSALCWLLRGFVWLTRRILWALMMVSHTITCWLSREMELDADRAQAVIA